MKELIAKAEQTHTLLRGELIALLEDDGNLDAISAAADRVRHKFVGDEVHLRALIEFSNFCKNNCCYCGLRRDNKKLTRYRLNENMIFNLAEYAVKQMGLKTIVLQSGEDMFFDCDKMNKQTSNSILKFLEEPAENIIAILATRNSNKLLKTITSRCQFLKLKSNFEFEDLKLCDDLDKKVHEFINYVEKFNYDTIIYTKELWFQYFNDKDVAEQAISRMIYFYYNKLKESCKMKESSNIIIDIIRKIEILVETKNVIKYNLNLNLLVDKMIMDLVGDNNESSFN